MLRGEIELRELVLACVNPYPCGRRYLGVMLSALQVRGPVSPVSSRREIEGLERLQEMSAASICILSGAYRDDTAVGNYLNGAKA